MMGSSMTDAFLDKEPEDLERFLLQMAREEVAPRAARERALVNVASAAVGVGLLSGAAAYGSRTSLAKATGWLVTKWLAVGLGSGLLTIAVGQGVQHLASTPAPSELPAQHAALAKPKVAVRVEPTSAQPITPESDAPVAEPSAPSPVPHAAFAPVAIEAVPVAPAPATPSASAPRAESTLTRELTVLEQARSALTRHAGEQALQALDDYQAAFPSGAMQIEAAALRVEAVGQTGRRTQAARLAEAFLASYPTSPLASRVRALSQTFQSNSKQP